MHTINGWNKAMCSRDIDDGKLQKPSSSPLRYMASPFPYCLVMVEIGIEITNERGGPPALLNRRRHPH